MAALEASLDGAEGRPLMARSLWTGSLSFGLVNVPVALYSAVRDLDVHFRQLHEKDGAPIETRRFCSEEDKEVPYEEIGHGYELTTARQVVLTDEELDAAAPRKTRTIDIEAFVDVDEVDPIYFDHPYFLVPVGEAEGNAARLPAAREGDGEHGPRRARPLRAAQQGVPGARRACATARSRSRRCASTTRCARRRAIDTGGRKPAKAELDAAVELIEALGVDWDPERYEDGYRERLLDVIERKRKGRQDQGARVRAATPAARRRTSWPR